MANSSIDFNALTTKFWHYYFKRHKLILSTLFDRTVTQGSSKCYFGIAVLPTQRFF